MARVLHGRVTGFGCDPGRGFCWHEGLGLFRGFKVARFVARASLILREHVLENVIDG